MLLINDDGDLDHWDAPKTGLAPVVVVVAN